MFYPYPFAHYQRNSKVRSLISIRGNWIYLSMIKLMLSRINKAKERF
ncbi:hypothetical protein DB41_CS00060 [Neochlamydia sp. TUME1]|nr:hypothetical protein DB41_CS00060 [Neochlamydia sp. TUME1]